MNPIYKKCVVRMVIFFGYGFLGSWLFSLIEKREESYAATANRLLENLREEMKSKYNITNSTDFDKFVKTASNAIQLMNKIDWSFFNGCGFTFAAITTVGFGHITPRTALGQVFTIPFCLIGLPITMLALKTAGEVILGKLTALTIAIEQKLFCRQNPEHKLIKCLAMIIFWISVLICVFAASEVYMDNLTFTQAVYCWFTTLTTIGFGDYIPYKQIYQTYKADEMIYWIVMVASLFSFVPFIIGLCLVSSLLNLLVDSSEKIKIHYHKVTNCTFCSRCNKRREANISFEKKDDHDFALQSSHEEEG